MLVWPIFIVMLLPKATPIGTLSNWYFGHRQPQCQCSYKTLTPDLHGESCRAEFDAQILKKESATDCPASNGRQAASSMVNQSQASSAGTLDRRHHSNPYSSV